MFVCRVDALSQRLVDEPGVRCEDSIASALIVGAEYLWNGDAYSRSFLWRTTKTKLSLSGFSGSVLVSGHPNGQSAKAICFQNWETTLSPQPMGDAESPQGLSYVRGGFFLPSDIQQSTIVMATSTLKPASSSLNRRPEPQPITHDRRAVTGPELSTPGV
jgi:hypothetical protein